MRAPYSADIFMERAQHINDKTIRTAYVSWIGQSVGEYYPVTLIFRDFWSLQGFKKQRLSLVTASEAVQLFGKNLSYRCFSQNDVRKRGKRVQQAWFREFSEIAGLHYHGIIEAHPKLNESIIESEWLNLECAADIHIGSDQSYKWLNYATKAATKQNFSVGDCFDPFCSYISPK